MDAWLSDLNELTMIYTVAALFMASIALRLLGRVLKPQEAGL